MGAIRAPKFSVIMPAHNAEGFIRKALDSIRSQHFTDYELIVVCDACEDNTARVAREYDARVFTTNGHCEGPPRNKGLDMAIGEWVLFMDDDDWWLHEYVLDVLDDVVGNLNEDMLFFSFIWKHIGYIRQTPERNFVAVWNKCWRRSFIGDTRFGTEPYGADEGFHKRCMAKKPSAVFLDNPLYYYNYFREGCLSQIKYGIMPFVEIPGGQARA